MSRKRTAQTRSQFLQFIEATPPDRPLCRCMDELCTSHKGRGYCLNLDEDGASVCEPCRSFRLAYINRTAEAPASRLEPSSTIEAGVSPYEGPCELIIEPNRIHHCWCIRVGHVHFPLPFGDLVDPMIVAKYITAKAGGPVNVVCVF